MGKNKRLIFIILLLVIFVVSGATVFAIININQKQSYKDDDGNTTLIEDYMGHINKYKKTDMKEELDVPIYSEHDLLWDDTFSFHFDQNSNRFDAMSARFDSIKKTLTVFPASAIRDRGDGTIYLTYEADTGARYYVFYTKDNDYYFPQGYTLYVDTVGTYNDYKEFKIGDSIDKLKQFGTKEIALRERLLEVGISRVQEFIEKGISPTVVHLLQDGIIKISYAINDNGDVFIADIIYSEDFSLKEYGVNVNYKILDIDLPEQKN